jgi:transcriptional regulator with XRE-family HTH domain
LAVSGGTVEGESLSHFLGRFRRANKLTPNGLGKMAGLSGAIARWEKFRFNPPPSPQQLEALAAVVGVERERLQEMLPPPGVGMKLEPIRLCGACYAQSPCHQIEWQFKTTQDAIGINYACCRSVPTAGRGLRFRLCGRRAGVSLALWSLGR